MQVLFLLSDATFLQHGQTLRQAQTVDAVLRPVDLRYLLYHSCQKQIISYRSDKGTPIAS